MLRLFKQKLEYRESKTNPDEIAINCPKCGDIKFHLGVSSKIGAFNCFKCGYKGHISKLVKDIFNINVEDIYTNNPSINVKTIKTIVKLPVELPHDFISLATNLTSYYSKYHDYLFNRRISLLQINIYNIGLSLTNNKGYLYIPIYDINNKQVYWTTRSINPSAEIKSILPKIQEGYYVKSDCLFNINNALKYNEVIITEGVFDAISIGRNGVAIMGKYLSDNQFRILKQLGFKRYIIALDNNAKKEAYDIADKLKGYCEDIFIAKYPDNRDINKLWVDDELHKIRYFKYNGLRL